MPTQNWVSLVTSVEARFAFMMPLTKTWENRLETLQYSEPDQSLGSFQKQKVPVILGQRGWI